MDTKTNTIKFYCTCNGCRGVAKRYDSSYVEGIIQELEGHFFSSNTRRFFGTRLTGFYVLSSGGVLITSTQKAGFADADGREINHAYFCKYGNLVNDYHFKTKTQARKALFSGTDSLDACPCHGCFLDREGR